MKLSIIYSINATISTIAAISIGSVGWLNCAIQLWIVTIIFYMKKI